MGKIRVLLVDDETAVRRGLRMLLESESDLEVVGEAANGSVALEMATSVEPDLVLMDVRMPAVDGIQATANIRTLHPQIRVLILTMFDDQATRLAAEAAGAAGVIAKHLMDEAIVQAIHDAMDVTQ
jgi:DNA-binding NarL/FixJ family response regulator